MDLFTALTLAKAEDADAQREPAAAAETALTERSRF
jgi:hypothetical protein